jgi:hypothetical protein
MILKVLIDANSCCFMGYVENDNMDSFQEVHDPLLFQYRHHSALNGTSIEFQPFDKYIIPRKIKSQIVTSFDPNLEQTRLYEEHHDIIFGQGEIDEPI